MAIKGDFEECEKCTSFQCNTCGLDQFGDGEITKVFSALKSFGFLALLYILSNFFDAHGTPIWTCIFPIGSAIITFLTRGKYLFIMYLIAFAPLIPFLLEFLSIFT